MLALPQRLYSFFGRQIHDVAFHESAAEHEVPRMESWFDRSAPVRPNTRAPSRSMASSTGAIAQGHQLAYSPRGPLAAWSRTRRAALLGSTLGPQTDSLSVFRVATLG
jgi:hypothetical protein